jgi:hypothetical protein
VPRKEDREGLRPDLEHFVPVSSDDNGLRGELDIVTESTVAAATATRRRHGTAFSRPGFGSAEVPQQLGHDFGADSGLELVPDAFENDEPSLRDRGGNDLPMRQRQRGILVAV